jgi:hypothetical protein
LRDIRRTYQRAFKALLFVHRFALSARRRHGEGSALGYMLSQPALFAGCQPISELGVDDAQGGFRLQFPAGR